MSKIFVIGAGVVGQATGKGFKSKGFNVTFIEKDPARVRSLKSKGYNALTIAEAKDLVHERDTIHFLTVSTPTVKGGIVLDHTFSAAKDLGKRIANAEGYQLVVNRSTVSPGTTQQIAKIIEKHSGKKLGKDFGICMNPEYLREVSAEQDFLKPWIVVIGAYDAKSYKLLEKAYKKFKAKIYRLKLEEAEMQKYIHNLFNAVKISYFNEMRMIAKDLGMDAEKVIKLVVESAEGIWNPEYGTKNYGPYDGSCLPKDTKAFYSWAILQGYDPVLLKAAMEVNTRLEGPL